MVLIRPTMGLSRSANERGRNTERLDDLRDDLDRLIFLLGGSDGGEQFLTGDHHQNGERSPTTTDRPTQ